MKLQSVLSLLTTYAVFTTPKVPHKEMVSSIHQTWNAVFSEWFPHSGYEHCGVTEFELYDERCHEDKSEFAQVELWIPVKKNNKVRANHWEMVRFFHKRRNGKMFKN